MLTVTYALVTLSVEQKKARGILSVLQQRIQRSLEELKTIDRSSFESVLYQLVQFDESCHWRNIERYVIPAVRRATTEADPLIAELESLSAKAETILRAIRGSSWLGFERGIEGVKELYSSMERYCHHLRQRLAKEEDELFPIAQRVISGEEWFEIAAQFISHDAETHSHKSSAPQSSHLPHPGAHYASPTRTEYLHQVPS